VIELKDVTKTFDVYRTPRARVMATLGLPIRANARDEFVAVRNVSFEIQPGERVGLVGRNGAGKSTVLKMVAGLLRPTSGTMEVRGNVQALLELGTGFHPEFTGRQNVYASLAYQGVAGREARRAFDDVLDFSELDEFIDRPVKTYSAGMYARLAFATATAVRPEVLIVDEILGAGDAYFALKSSQRMLKLTSDGTTVLFVSHDISSVQMMCDRAIWIDRGSMLMDGPPHEVSRAYSASIRRQAEMRLRAENLNLLRGQVEALGSVADGEPLVWRLIGDEGKPPEAAVRILRILASVDGIDLDPLDVGGARDNDQSEQLHLLTAPEFMNWGPPKSDANGNTYRDVGDFGGVYIHAPFALRRRSVSNSTAKVTVEHGPVPPGGRLLLQQHTHDGYRTVAVIEPGPAGSVSSEQLREAEVATALVEEALFDEDARYGSDPRAITAVQFTGLDLEPRYVYEAGEPMEVHIDWSFQAGRTPTAPVFVVCVYGLDGRCVTQVWSRPLPACPTQGSIRARLEPVRFGRGDYLVSVGIFDGLSDDDPGADEPICVLDRSFKIKVIVPPGHRIERGMTLQDASWGEPVVTHG
jgi:lipopolysaccharide transport system ATP-binding protein